jgi:hypothetical protein
MGGIWAIRKQLKESGSQIGAWEQDCSPTPALQHTNHYDTAPNRHTGSNSRSTTLSFVLVRPTTFISPIFPFSTSNAACITGQIKKKADRDGGNNSRKQMQANEP